MREQLDELLQTIGYQLIPSNLPEFAIYFQQENNFVNVVHVVEDKEGLYLTKDQLEHIKEKIVILFREKGLSNIHILSLILSEDLESMKKIVQEDYFCWMLRPSKRSLVIYENQAADFYGLKGILENWLLLGETESLRGGETLQENWFQKLKKKSYITIFLTALNVIIFLICTFTGDLLYNIGELNAILVFEGGEYYRIITCMFLHGDINHLSSNMIILYFLGKIVEKSMGPIRYIFLYLVAGIGGGMLSMIYALSMGNIVNSIGASGAIFGVTGALLWVVIVHKGKVEEITLGKVLFLILYSTYSGFIGTNIDNAAHIGGIFAGFLFTVLFYRKKRENPQTLRKARLRNED